MDAQLQEIVRQIADAVDKKVSMRLDDVEARLMTRFDEAEARLSARIDEAEARLTSAAKANMEELREFLRETAERNDAVLESIERRLTALEQKVDTSFADHGKMLRQHTLQLNALGRKQVAPRLARR
jgi:RNase adaptor protein for sRNA GlmZ degradation